MRATTLIAAARPPLLINPTSLRRLLLDRNVSVLTTLNNVYIAKEEVARARAELIPSIGAAGSLATGSGFGLSSVSFLLPFLMPSNWFNIKVREHQLAANGYAFYLVELNEYSSAYALFLNILGDQRQLEATKQMADNLEKLVSDLQAQSQQGTVPDNVLGQFQIQAQLFKIQFLQLKNSLAREKASFRKLLALPLDRDFVFENTHPLPLSIENASPAQALENAYPRSAEKRQIESLILAGDSATWSSSFNFLGGTTLVPEVTGSSVSFSHLTVGASGELGLGKLPEVRISQKSVDALKLRRSEIKLEMARVIEANLASLKFAKQELIEAVEADRIATAMGTPTTGKAGAPGGLAELLNTMQAAQLKFAASSARISAELAIDLERVTLERIMVAHEFANITRCRLDKVEPDNNPFGWLSDIIDPDAAETTVDKSCR